MKELIAFIMMLIMMFSRGMYTNELDVNDIDYISPAETAEIIEELALPQEVVYLDRTVLLNDGEYYIATTSDLYLEACDMCLDLYVENKSNNTVMLVTYGGTMNGEVVDTWFGGQLGPGESVSTTMYLAPFVSYEEFGPIEEIQISLGVSDASTWDALAQTGEIVLEAIE